MPAIPLQIAIKHISSLLLSFTIIGSAVSPKNARADAFIRSGWQWISLLLLLGLLVNSSGVAHADSMKFSHYNSGGNHCCWWIAAEGDITPDTPREFEKFLGRAPNPEAAQMLGGGGTIRLHSAGGSLIAALELGYLIRKYHLYTTVGRTTPQPDDGTCASACAYAFLGGVQRTLDPGAKLGVHRFYRGSAADNLAAGQYSGKDLDDTQRVFATLVLYIRNMGVDLALVGLADQAAPNQIHWVTQAKAQDLRITNDLNSWSAWKIEPHRSGVIALSQRADGNARMTLYCSRKDGRFLLVAARKWNYQYASQLASYCALNGWHSVFGARVSSRDAVALTLSDGTQAVRFKLPEAIPFLNADVFGTSYACALNFGGSMSNLAQSARIAFSNCID